MDRIWFADNSRDWTEVVRTRRDVRRCKRGKHERVMVARDAGMPVCRCSCGAIEFEYAGIWVAERDPVGLRTQEEVDKRVASRASYEEAARKLQEWGKQTSEFGDGRSNQN